MHRRLSYILSEYQQRSDCIPDHGIYTCSQLQEIVENKQKLARQTTIKKYIQERIANLRKEGRNSYTDMNNIKRNGKLDFGYKFSYKNFNRYLNLCLKRLGQEMNI